MAAVTDAMLQDPAPGDWLMWRRTRNGWGYSPLDQINRDNVRDLRMIWTRALRAGSDSLAARAAWARRRS
jgi:alcohol dehydrogenase (cytochrome c)